MGNAVPLGNIPDNRSSSQSGNVTDPSSQPSQPSQQRSTPVELRAANSFESRESRPTSPHNVSSPASQWGHSHNFLAVPGARSRGNSLDSTSEIAESSAGTGTTYIPSEGETLKGGAGTDEILNDAQALRPDPGTEDEFKVEDNKFAFSPGHLSKLLNPKSLGAFHALGGMDGIEKGLRTSRKNGLSIDEQYMDGYVSFEDATAPSLSDSPVKPAPEKAI